MQKDQRPKTAGVGPFGRREVQHNDSQLRQTGHSIFQITEGFRLHYSSDALQHRNVPYLLKLDV
jgi:hypothetical protein